MSYCTLDDIKSDFKDIVFTPAAATSPSSITEEEVIEWIAQECAYIEAKICNKYQVPVVEGDSPNSFKILKRINIGLVSNRVRHVLKVKTGDDSKEQVGRSMHFSPKKDLKEIQEGTLKLGDAVANSDCGGFDVGSPKSCDDMVFDPSKNQW